jgi:ribosomal protein L31
VFLWQQAGRGYLVGSDDEETGTTDVDIWEVTDPRAPALISETGLSAWPDAQSPLANGNTVFNHDMTVTKIKNRWTLLSSYWDAGYIELDVTDPAHPVFIGDTDFAATDPLTGLSPPEGNGHYAEFDRKGRVFIGTDEDFQTSRLESFQITTGPNAGSFPGGEFGFSRPISELPDSLLSGPTVFGGYGCNDDVAEIPPPSVLGSLGPDEESILVLQRGPVNDPNHPHAACRFDEKIQNAANAGYDAVVIANHHNGAGGGQFPDSAFCGSGEPRTIFAVCTGHRAFHLLFDRTPDYTIPYPAGDPGDLEPNPGDLGAKISAKSIFDGWGYIHLFDGETLQDLDQLAIPEALDPAFARGFGALSVHEVTFSQSSDIAYLSWYAGGFRVVSFANSRLEEVGHFIDVGGNDFWGVQLHKAPDGTELVLASDRDAGLYIFRYTGPRKP